MFPVMLSAVIADLVSRQFLGPAPFLSGLPQGIALHHASSYLLVAGLAVVAGLLGLAFKNVLYLTEDLCDRVWHHRPEWARPAVGGVALGLLLLALPQMYGVGYPVLYRAVGGDYALWFLVVLAAGKMIATSLTIGIGGSGGVFAPSLFIGATSGMAFGEIAGHTLGPAAGQPALYAVVGMGAVFASAARAPLTAVASVLEMTGDYALTLPVMLAVAIATALSRALSYGTIYTTKLLRRGIDLDARPSATGPAGPPGSARGRGAVGSGGIRGGGVPAEHLVQGRAEAAVGVDDPADDHDQRGDGPEVAADPQDAGPDLLIGERRERHPGDVVVDRVPGHRGQDAHRHGQDPHDDVGGHDRDRLRLRRHSHPERRRWDELQPEQHPGHEEAGVHQPDVHGLVVLGQVEQGRDVPGQHHDVEGRDRDPGPQEPAADRTQRP
jgi:hypothetical protein